MLRRSAIFMTLVLAPMLVRAAEGKVEVTKAAIPDLVAPEIAAKLAPQAIEVTVGGKKVCEVWLAKSWPVQEGFKPTPNVLYPFAVGQLIGVIKFPGRAGDFRNQQFAGGVYTLRYGKQPQDGNHVGTSDTRDFLVLAPAKKDTKPDDLEMEAMHTLSKEVTRATHPAILSMLTAGEAAEKPSLQHYPDRELVALRVAGDAVAGSKDSKLTIEFVLVGHAPE